MKSTILRDLRKQDSEHRMSDVSPLSAAIDLQSVFTDMLDLPVLSREDYKLLSKLEDLLNWSYGYRKNPIAGQYKRNAPSAGGRYPTEVIIVLKLDCIWQLLIYDFSDNEFKRLPIESLEALAVELGLSENHCLFITIAVSWRTLHRYGVRGYRYCLVDSACVASNILELIYDSGAEGELYPFNCCATITDKVDLPKGVLVTAAISCCTDSIDTIPWQDLASLQRKTERLNRSSLFTEEPPHISPAIERVVVFHRKALKSASGSPVIKPIKLDRETRTPFVWVSERVSSTGFDGKPLEQNFYENLLAHLQQFLEKNTLQGNTSPAAITFQVAPEGRLLPRADYLRASKQPSTVQLLQHETMASFSNTVFQNQRIVSKASVIIMIGMPKSYNEIEKHCEYSENVLDTGMLIADLHRYIATTDFGCTAIGGFSDNAFIKAISIDDFFPLMAFQVGNDVECDIKVDSQDWLLGKTLTHDSNQTSP